MMKDLLNRLKSIIGQTVEIEGYGNYDLPETSIFVSAEYVGYLKVKRFDVLNIFRRYTERELLPKEIPDIVASYENLVIWDEDRVFIEWFDKWLSMGLIEKEGE